MAKRLAAHPRGVRPIRQMLQPVKRRPAECGIRESYVMSEFELEVWRVQGVSEFGEYCEVAVPVSCIL
ncbi:MAG: hypothetical protein OEQ28_04315 [Acidobacteriota bacterium]|nr:hypothetical protein [Acidobacteriota bacterium]